jgi:hypothetical protein
MNSFVIHTLRQISLRQNQSREDEMGRVCSTHENMRSAYSILIRKCEGRGCFGDPGKDENII